MAKLLEFLDRHTARNLFRSSHLKRTIIWIFFNRHLVFPLLTLDVLGKGIPVDIDVFLIRLVSTISCRFNCAHKIKYASGRFTPTVLPVNRARADTEMLGEGAGSAHPLPP